MDKETDSESSERGPKGKVILTEARCKGCSFCVEFCPTRALVLGTRLNQKGYRLPELGNPDKCNGCDLCGLFCPDFAIFGVRLGREKKGE